MLSSMTGYGAGTSSDEQRAYSVEIRTVNHKFCDVKVKLPRDCNALEPQIQHLVRKRIARGRVEVLVDVSMQPNIEMVALVDTTLARSYQNGLESLREALGLTEPVSLSLLANLPGVLKAPETRLDPDAVLPSLTAALDVALQALDGMRRNEGQGLQTQIEGLLTLVEQGVAAVENCVSRSIDERTERLRKRLQDTLLELELDEARLAQEVAILVDRSDISEELSRMAIHLTQFRRLLSSGEPVGRKLDFLLQEMNREVNTTGAKCSDAQMAHSVVELKSNLERIREQVQNVE
jgi:uncharacterized protein (TIGR00255 family)